MSQPRRSKWASFRMSLVRKALRLLLLFLVRGLLRRLLK